jgi:hypothetical protein
MRLLNSAELILQSAPAKASAFVSVAEKDDQGNLQRVLLVLNKKKTVHPKNQKDFNKPYGWSLLGGGVKIQKIIPNLSAECSEHCETAREGAVRELFEEGQVVLDTGDPQCNEYLLQIAEEIKLGRYAPCSTPAYVEFIHRYSQRLKERKVLKPVLAERKINGHRVLVFEAEIKQVVSDLNKLGNEFDFARNTIEVRWFTTEELRQAAETRSYPVYPIVLKRLAFLPYDCETSGPTESEGVASVLRFVSA